MKKVFSIVLIFFAVQLMLINGSLGKEETKAQKENPAKHIGLRGCNVYCHDSPAIGNQIGKWMKSRHAQAYYTLGTSKAKKIARHRKIEDPQKSPKCLRCHVTGYDAPEEQKGKDYKITEGVSCEACHGAGEKYILMRIMTDRKLGLEHGLIIPGKKECIKCHNRQSPTYRRFNYKKSLKKIAHPVIKGGWEGIKKKRR